MQMVRSLSADRARCREVATLDGIPSAIPDLTPPTREKQKKTKTQFFGGGGGGSAQLCAAVKHCGRAVMASN